MKFEIFTDTDNQYRFRVIANNHKIIAQSEGYKNLADCRHAINIIKENSENASVIDPFENKEDDSFLRGIQDYF